MTTKSRYQAPALKKGLEILELLAAAEQAQSMSDISTALGRSVGEIFRMLQVLEEHRYIARDDDGYRLTNRLFALGMGRPPIRDLTVTALPVMQELARATGQSCHLAVASGAEMAVIAGVEAPGLSGFAVRVGYRRPLHRSASGRVLLAFQSPAVREAMLAEVRTSGVALDATALVPLLDTLVAEGGGVTPSPVLDGITDLSAPILAHDSARAALTVPFVAGPAARVTMEDCRQRLRAAVRTISGQLHPTLE
ncbi:IclR family transcriptional regulator [Sphingomonas endophytica]|uniref:Transcriptional regulator n=1 Tax=Sphingomonas endophytica TaxID=869719 RepID=A0A147HVJ4_9SPHN|nr:IclR family transcriptional regulator [Sphingomonas endophytica]KTT68931.1 transcriptional regulator [Sphingomonas endophytica]